MKGFRCVHRVGEVQLKIISQTPPCGNCGNCGNLPHRTFPAFTPFPP
jgi:hypothetical protein